ncbi:hypothetical protein AAEX28_09425 [Lentisphaerota bacterium WC36G]|nr:hypothetical protein LJT99_12265 [Lentisphaerae bacterium WC36]
MTRKLEIIGVIIFIIIILIWGGGEIYLRKFADGEEICKKANDFNNKGNKSTAWFLFNIATRTSYKNAYIELGAFYYKNGDIDNARAIFTQAGNKFDKYCSIYAGMLYYKIEDIPKVTKYWKNCSKKGNLNTLICLHQLYLEQGDYNAAKKLEDKYLKLKDGQTMRSFALGYYFHKDYQKASELS